MKAATLSRHVGVHVSAAVLLVLVVLAGLFGVAEFADELSGAPKGAGTLDVLIYVACRLPAILLDNLGFAMLLGCLMGLGVLASQSELTVMRASGVSPLRIVWMVMRPMLVLILVGAALGEYVTPQLRRDAELRFAAAGDPQNERQLSFATGAGLWLRQDNDFLHFSDIRPDRITGFSWVRFNSQRELEAVGYSPTATLSAAAWQLDLANVTLFTPDATQAAAGQTGVTWDSRVAPDLLSLVVSEPANMNMQELFVYLDYLEAQAQDGRQFALAFWKKALRPLGMIGMVLVAISFIFGPLRSSTMGYKLFTGIMIGVAFRFAQDLLAPISLVFGLSPIVAVALPIVVSWCLGFALLARVR